MASITYRDEEVWSKGYGVDRKGIDGKTPGTETIYRIASVSKIFVVSNSQLGLCFFHVYKLCLSIYIHLLSFFNMCARHTYYLIAVVHTYSIIMYIHVYIIYYLGINGVSNGRTWLNSLTR